MDSFFGIGIMELAFIAILALIVLGPERLPSAARETAKFFGQLRALSSEFTSQFSEELQMLDEINPKRLADEITREAMNPAKKPAGAATAKKSAQTAAKPLAPSQTAASKSTGPAKKTETTASATTAAGATPAAIAADGSTTSPPSEEQMPENSILPPEDSSQNTSAPPATNGTDPNVAAPQGNSPEGKDSPAPDVSGNTPAGNKSPSVVSDEDKTGTERVA